MSAAAPRSAGVRRWLRLTVTLLLLGALLSWVGWSAVLDALRAADPVWVVIGWLAATLANAGCAWRWRALAGWLGHQVDGGWALWAYFRGQALNAVLPGATMGGDLWRVWALQRLGVPWSHASISVLLDRVIGLWALVWLGAVAVALALTLLPSVAAWPWGTPLWPWAAVALLLALALWLVPLPLLRWGAQATWTDRPWGRWWRTLAQRQPQRQWSRQRWLALLAQTATLSAWVAAAQAVGLTLPWWWLVPAATPIFLAAALPVGLGGWGTREAAAAAVLGSLGAPIPQALALSVLFGLYPLMQAPLGLLPPPRPR